MPSFANLASFTLESWHRLANGKRPFPALSAIRGSERAISQTYPLCSCSNSFGYRWMSGAIGIAREIGTHDPIRTWTLIAAPAGLLRLLPRRSASTASVRKVHNTFSRTIEAPAQPLRSQQGSIAARLRLLRVPLSPLGRLARGRPKPRRRSQLRGGARPPGSAPSCRHLRSIPAFDLRAGGKSGFLPALTVVQEIE